MTDHDLRIRLAEAMGWTDVREPQDPVQMGDDTTGIPPEGHRSGYRRPIPDPLESDRDAIILRAWCAGQGWRITCCHDEGAAWWRVSDLRCQGPRAESMVDAKEEPDYCRRERLALCRSVLAVLEAGGEA